MMVGRTQSTFHGEGEAQLSLQKLTQREKRGLDPKPLKWTRAFPLTLESFAKATLALPLSAADTLGLALQTENFDARLIIES